MKLLCHFGLCVLTAVSSSFYLFIGFSDRQLRLLPTSNVTTINFEIEKYINIYIGSRFTTNILKAFNGREPQKIVYFVDFILQLILKLHSPYFDFIWGKINSLLPYIS